MFDERGNPTVKALKHRTAKGFGSAFKHFGDSRNNIRWNSPVMSDNKISPVVLKDPFEFLFVAGHNK